MSKKVLTATERLRRNVKQQIYRMEKRGYRISSEAKEIAKTGKYQSLKSLQREKYGKLYKQSTGEVEGKVVSGPYKRQAERKESAQRAAQTRKERATSGNFERERTARDVIDRQKASKIQEGQIVYDQINDLIERYPTKGSVRLQQEMRRQISLYGLNNVLEHMGQYPSYFVQLAQEIVFYESSNDDLASAFMELFNMMRGEEPNEEMLMDMGEALDDMSDYDEEY